jgi:GNAT superfamily N-acetyltransferase
VTEPIVRRATPADADELARLRWDFRVEHGTPVTRDVEEFGDEFRAFVAQTLAPGTPWRAWVAEADDRLVGCAWVRFVDKVPHPGRRHAERPIAYLTNVYVEPSRRNGGLGSRLMDAALGHARDSRAGEAIVWPTERSLGFYRRAGFGPGGPLWMSLEGD